jgi:hypothetical protein
MPVVLIESGQRQEVRAPHRQRHHAPDAVLQHGFVVVDTLHLGAETDEPLQKRLRRDILRDARFDLGPFANQGDQV